MSKESRRFAVATKVKNQNYIKYRNIVLICLNAIVKQGAGCNDDMGAAYRNSAGQKCVIGHLIPIKFFHSLYGEISSEQLRPVVAEICRKYQIDIVRTEDYKRTTQFLQELQNAHDACFDKFKLPTTSNIENLKIFTNWCISIKNKYTY